MAQSVNEDTSHPDSISDAAADCWIWGLWIVIALLSVAVLPFASRFKEFAYSIASFCGMTPSQSLLIFHA